VQPFDERGLDLARGYLSLQDRSFRLLAANRRFVEDFGAFEGRHCYEVYKRRTEPCNPCPVAETFRDGASHGSRQVVRTLAGHDVEVLVDTAPVTGEDGSVTAVIEMTTALAPIRDLRSQATTLGLIIGSVSQDLKGLLTAVDGGFYLLSSGLKKDDPSRVARGCEMVRRNVDRIRSLTLDVLYYARDRELARAPVEAGAIVEEAAAGAARRADEHGIELVCEIHPSAGVCEVDAGAVRAMIANLLGRAIDTCRMDPSRPDHLVRIRAEGSGEQVQVTVSDSGRHVERKAWEQAFSPALSPAEADSAALELFVAHKIARLHGGRIDVGPDRDRGTRLTVSLPRRPAPRYPT
jgi:signal transduction histidine kinase